MTTTHDFLTLLRNHYRAHARSMPWRLPEPDGSYNAYKILVSEMMLQQTQVLRVVPKYEQFLRRFPDINALAEASLPAVLNAWSGLGYNRRAKYLHEAAVALQHRPEPWVGELLVAQKGIGSNTAAAVLAYSYNLPVLFLETNIKTVLIHHYFEDKQGIADKELLSLLEQVVPWNNGMATSPREFYWSLMDYGSHLKATVGNQARRSRSYTKQSPFQGSKRQLRGRIIRLLLNGPLAIDKLQAEISDERLDDTISTLVREQMVKVQGKTLMLYNIEN